MDADVEAAEAGADGSREAGAASAKLAGAAPGAPSGGTAGAGSEFAPEAEAVDDMARGTPGDCAAMTAGEAAEAYVKRLWRDGGRSGMAGQLAVRAETRPRQAMKNRAPAPPAPSLVRFPAPAYRANAGSQARGSIRMKAVIFALLVLAGLAAAPAHAGEDAVATRKTLENGQTAAGELAMAARLATDPKNNEARFGLGLIRFARAIERFGQTQYRYGLRPPHSVNVPLLRYPVPVNPSPEELTYEKQRDGLKALLDDLAGVEATLAPMTDDHVRIVLDLNAIKFDLRGDGKPDDLERLAAILAKLSMTPVEGQAKPEPFEVGFDNADALWLRGYAHLLSASIEFVLAYDWSRTFEATAQLFYPRATPSPLANVAEAPGLERDGWLFRDDAHLADLIALLHEIRWPVAEPARMKSAHAHLKQVIALNKAMWKVIEARSDDDKVWIPGPKQKHGVIASMPVTEEQVAAWLGALDEFDAILDGRKLAPHWRFAQGLNIRKVFFEPRPFDLVLWITGQAAAPYLEAGPITSGAQWSEWSHVFNDNFPGYAFWFN